MFVPGYATPSWSKYVAADAAWTVETGRVFGRDSGDARYELRGRTATPELVATYAKREQLRLQVERERETMAREGVAA